MITLSNEIVTLDISSISVRLLSARRGRIERWASASINPGLVEDGFISDPPALGVAIKQLMKTSGIKSRKPVVSITGLYSMCHLVHVIPSQGQSAEESLSQVAAQSIPLLPEEVYISTHMIYNDSDGQLALVIGMPRNQVDAQLEALQSIRIRPRSLVLKGIALARLVDQPVAVIVNLEPDVLEIALVANGIPEILRTVSQPPNSSLDLWVGSLIQAVEQTIHFYAYKHKMDPLHSNFPLILTGEWSVNPDVMEILQSSLSLSVIPPAISLEYPANLPVAEYAVNIGLMLNQIPSQTTTEEVELTAEIKETDE